MLVRLGTVLFGTARKSYLNENWGGEFVTSPTIIFTKLGKVKLGIVGLGLAKQGKEIIFTLVNVLPGNVRRGKEKNHIHPARYLFGDVKLCWVLFGSARKSYSMKIGGRGFIGRNRKLSTYHIPDVV